MNALTKLLLGIGLAASAAVGLARPAAIQAPPSSITQCGTVINSPGVYDVEQSLTSTSTTVDCIQVAAPGVRLIIPENISLSGPGGSAVTAAGVKILKSAYGVQMLFVGATIQGFGIGIEVDASGASISGAPTGGIITGNAADGVLVSDASDVLIESLASEQNGAAGLELSHSSGVTVQGLSMAQSNKGYGLWVRSSSGNQFFNFDSSENTLSGIFVGESSNSRFGLALTDADSSNDNVFVSSGAVQNGGAGFLIGAGDSRNVVTSSTGQSNANKDAVDQNPNCDHNGWTGNDFATSNATCIH